MKLEKFNIVGDHISLDCIGDKCYLDVKDTMFERGKTLNVLCGLRNEIDGIINILGAATKEEKDSDAD